MPHRLSFARSKSLAAIGLTCLGLVAANDAHAAITCVNPQPTVTVLSTWTPNVNWDVPQGTQINVLYVEIKYRVRKGTDGVERVAVRTNWAGGGSQWVASELAMRFGEGPGNAKGYGLQILALGDGNRYTTPTEHGRGQIFELTGGAQQQMDVWTRFMYVIKKIDAQTTAGTFGIFGTSTHWGPDALTNVAANTWEPAAGCTGGGATDFNQLGAALGSGVTQPPPPPAPTVACMINNGQDMSFALPPVGVDTMNQVGAQPIGYPKREFSVGYACTGTGVVTTDPAYTMALVGQKAGTTNALASNRTGVGVMVEAVDTRNGTHKAMTPNPTASAAEKVRIYDAGRPGGSSLKIQAYPVRSQAGAITAGTFTASGTLQIFTQ